MIPCERARQLLDVKLSRDVSLAAATALCSGKRDPPQHPNSTGNLKGKKKKATFLLDYDQKSNRYWILPLRLADLEKDENRRVGGGVAADPPAKYRAAAFDLAANDQRED